VSAKADFTPNVSFPFAVSNDQRDLPAYTELTDGTDQRKLNVVSTLIQNGVTGSAKLKLVKRPGGYLHSSAFGDGNSSGLTYHLTDSTGADLFTCDSTGGGVSVAANGGVWQSLIAGPSLQTTAFADQTSITGALQNVIQSRSTSAASGQRVFYGDTAAGVWTEINVVSANFAALAHVGKMEFLDGYPFILTTTNRVYNGVLNTLGTWNTGTDYLTKQIEQDTPVGLARYGKQILVFGMDSFEVMYNAGNATGSPLATSPQLAQKYGLAWMRGTSGLTTQRMKYTYYVVAGSTLFFLGNKAGAYKSVSLYAYQNGNVDRVSNDTIDKILASDTYLPLHVTVNAVMGRTAICVVLAIASGGSRWLWFFPDTKEWYEGSSVVFTPFNPVLQPCLPSFGGANEVYKIGWGGTDNATPIYTDAGTAYEASVQFALPGATAGQRRQHKWLAVEGNTPASSVALDVSVSDDDYNTWTSLGQIDLAQQVKRITRLGGFYSRKVKLSYTGDQPMELWMLHSRID